MRLLIIVSLLLNILAEPINAQLRLSPLETFNEAWEFFSYDEYEEALPLLYSIYSEEENNSHLQYLIGVCYLNNEGQKQKALPFLEKASKNITTVHQSGSFNEKSAPIESLYYLGIAYRLARSFNKSLEAFARLRDLAGNSYDMEQVARQTIITKNAKRFYRYRQEVIVLPWEDQPPVHQFHENIVISGDELTIVYTEEQSFYDAVFYTRYEEEGWTDPVNITMQIRSDGLAWPSCLSWDGTELYLHQYDRFSNTNLYVSRLEGNKWSVMQSLGENINSEGFDQNATKTRDGKTIYFASSRTSGKGGFDIYRSRLNENNKWEPAENLGHPVNSGYDESFPFISPDGNTLYFSSTGHTGTGGYDIFVSGKSSSGQWTVPRNLGFPINTPDDDAGLIPVDNGSVAYLNKRSEENTDITEFRKIKSFDPDMTSTAILGINISSKSTDALSEVTVSLKQTEPAESTIPLPGYTNQGDYEIELPWGKYILEVSSPAHETKTFDITIHEYYPEEKYTVNTELDQLKAESESDSIPVEGTSYSTRRNELAVFKIQPAFFGFDSYIPDQESCQLTLNIAGIMNEHKEMTVELRAHTDALGPAAYNEHLSERRAENVADMLAGEGVERERIKTTAVGMGNYIAKNRTSEGRDNPQGRRYNRRVEFIFSNVPEVLRIVNSLDLPEHLKKQ